MGSQIQELRNYVGGAWAQPSGAESREVWNPATGEAIARVQFSSSEDVAAAVSAAQSAFLRWRRTSPNDRAQFLFRLKDIVEQRLDDLARSITEEHGKLLSEARGEVRRALDNVDMACGTPANLQGRFAEDISSGIDEMLIRQPVGVCAAIVPFNFPLMIPCWFLPYAIACGNTFILKASERTPRTVELLFELLDALDLPPGVVNLVHGGQEASELLIDHPDVRAISFVGSTPAARAVYARAAKGGKRAQAQGGAKNALVILPDAPVEAVAAVAAESAFGNAGQRCLAGSSMIAVGSAGDAFAESISALARSKTLGNGLVDGVTLGPVITGESARRVESLVERGAADGGSVLVDGRGMTVEGHPKGFFVGATVVDHVSLDSTLAVTEVFGPVLGIMRVDDLDEAISRINGGQYGNMACLFTASGNAARRFRYDVEVGNVGVNVGVAQPMSSFPFSGWGDSFFGDLHAHGHHAIEFFTQTKVVVERWP
jgi:malonate-semialdehyde dehydrogenase (acetylating)/methylmalonate-semialdehyde dehydrogenase